MCQLNIYDSQAKAVVLYGLQNSKFEKQSANIMRSIWFSFTLSLSLENHF